MPLTPFFITQAIRENAAADTFGFQGVNFNRIALGLGFGVWAWAVGNPTNLALAGMATGPAGAGNITPPLSKIVLPVPLSIGVMRAAFLGAGLNGITANPLSVVVALGICQAFNRYAGYTAPVTVGTGSDVSKVAVVNVASLAAILTGTLAGSLTGAGPTLPMLAMGLSAGIGGILLLGTGSAAVVGVPSIPTVPLVVPTYSMVV